MNRDFEGVWIPYKLIEGLKPNLKLIFEIVSYYYFKKSLEIYNWKHLVELGLAKKTIFSPEEIRLFVGNKSPQKILAMHAHQICSWCKANTYRLHSHHFPKSRKNGGLETVEICASCHDEYHFMNDCFYSLTDKVYRWFKEVSHDQ